MKTERRHQLETNELADSLAHWVEAARPYFRMVVGLVIAAIVLSFVYAAASRHSAAKAQEAWDEYFQALNQMSREKFDDLADKYPGTPAAWWARTILGDMNLDEGSNLLYRDRPQARERLNAAVEQYETVLKEAKESAVLVRATYGLARAQEGLGELKAARESYLKIVTRWPTNALADAAQARAKDLKRAETQEFYDWFKQQIRVNRCSTHGKTGRETSLRFQLARPRFQGDLSGQFPGQRTGTARCGSELGARRDHRPRRRCKARCRRWSGAG